MHRDPASTSLIYVPSPGMPGGIQVYPSLLAADPLTLGAAVTGVEDAVDWLHVDVMDYHFVPTSPTARRRYRRSPPTPACRSTVT